MPNKIAPTLVEYPIDMFRTTPNQRTPASKAAFDLATQFQNQQDTVFADRPRSREAIRHRANAFGKNLEVLVAQSKTLLLQTDSNTKQPDTTLIAEIEEVIVITKRLLTDLASIPRGALNQRSDIDMFSGLNADLHNFLLREITFKRVNVYQRISEKIPELRAQIISDSNLTEEHDIETALHHTAQIITNAAMIDELIPPSRVYMENLVQTHDDCPANQTINLENAISTCSERINDIQRMLKCYADVGFKLKDHQILFGVQQPVISDLLGKAEDYHQQWETLKVDFFVSIKVKSGNIVEHNFNTKEAQDFRVYAVLLPIIEQLGELGISSLAHLIENNTENQKPFFQEKQLLQLLNELCYFTEKLAWATRELFSKQGWQSLLQNPRSPGKQEADSLLTSPAANLNAIEHQIEDCSLEDLPSPSTIDTHFDKRAQRANTLLGKSKNVLAYNPMSLLESAKRNPGFYSPFTVQQTYLLFNTHAEKTCDAIAALKPKMERLLQIDDLDSDLRNALEHDLNNLAKTAEIMNIERQYSRSDDFRFDTLKLHKTPRAESWITLFENAQLASISFMGKLPTELADDHLYEFELVPTPNSIGERFPSVWLHVHLRKEIHTPKQWHSLDPGNINAAHLKPDHARNLGAKWQQEQRVKGNYDTVIARSKVNIDFIKLMANNMIMPTDSGSAARKGKTRRK